MKSIINNSCEAMVLILSRAAAGESLETWDFSDSKQGLSSWLASLLPRASTTG